MRLSEAIELARSWPRRTRLLLLAGITLAAIVLTLLLPRIPQSQAYHEFADRRALLGIPNCLNVLSNVVFLVVGVFGLAFLLRAKPGADAAGFTDSRERFSYLVFFLGVALTAFGSAYYHLAPDNARLVWDRLPMTLGFTGFLAAMMVERISLRAGLWLLGPLALLGMGSVFYWHATELAGVGDLRFYGLVQFYPVVAIPLLVLFFPGRYTRTADLLAIGGFYFLAKMFELLDQQIFALGQIVSGHTLKHLAAGAATYWLLRMLRLRSPARMQG